VASCSVSPASGIGANPGSAQLALRAATRLTGSSLGGQSQCRICEDVLLRARRSTTTERSQQTRGNSRRRAWHRRRRTGQRHDIDADDDPVFALQKGTEPLQLSALLLLLDEQLALLLQLEILLLFSERRRARLESTLRAASNASPELLGYRCTLLGREALQDLQSGFETSSRNLPVRVIGRDDEKKREQSEQNRGTALHRLHYESLDLGTKRTLDPQPNSRPRGCAIVYEAPRNSAAAIIRRRACTRRHCARH